MYFSKHGLLKNEMYLSFCCNIFPLRCFTFKNQEVLFMFLYLCGCILQLVAIIILALSKYLSFLASSVVLGNTK